MALSSHHLLSRVGSTFGSGRHGSLTISSNTTQSLTEIGCSGSSGQADLTIASGAFTNEDLVLIYQSRGTGVGQWEINRVLSGGGSTTLTMYENLVYTYTNSGASQAQIINIPEYTDVTINSGNTLSATSWNADVNGILMFACTGHTSVVGNLSADGKGFRGGSGQVSSAANDQGEGAPADRNTNSTSANGNAGGGGYHNNNVSGGGGGSLGTQGNNGTNGSYGSTGGPGLKGATDGNAELTDLVFGGSGGAGSAGGPNGVSGGSGAGGNGGGAILIFSNTITVTGTISCDGANGSNGTNGNGDIPAAGGGGGSGGSILIQTYSGTFGTNLLGSSGGSGGSGGTGSSGTGGNGGSGGQGRIAVHYGSSVSGSSTTPSFNSYSNTNLVSYTPRVMLFG